MDLKKPVNCPSKPRGSPTILHRRRRFCWSLEHLLLLLSLWTQRKPLLESASLWDPEVYEQTLTEWEVWEYTPFPTVSHIYWGREIREKACKNWNVDLTYGKLRKKWD